MCGISFTPCGTLTRTTYGPAMLMSPTSTESLTEGGNAGNAAQELSSDRSDPNSCVDSPIGFCAITVNRALQRRPNSYVSSLPVGLNVHRRRVFVFGREACPRTDHS